MRGLTDSYPPFKDTVELYVVAFNETLIDLQDYQNQSGHAGTVAKAVGNIVRHFRVTQQSAKVAIDANGIITYRSGYGRGGPSEWAEVLKKLAGSAQ